MGPGVGGGTGAGSGTGSVGAGTGSVGAGTGFVGAGAGGSVGTSGFALSSGKSSLSHLVGARAGASVGTFELPLSSGKASSSHPALTLFRKVLKLLASPPNQEGDTSTSTSSSFCTRLLPLVFDALAADKCCSEEEETESVSTEDTNLTSRSRHHSATMRNIEYTLMFIVANAKLDYSQQTLDLLAL